MSDLTAWITSAAIQLAATYFIGRRMGLWELVTQRRMHHPNTEPAMTTTLLKLKLKEIHATLCMDVEEADTADVYSRPNPLMAAVLLERLRARLGREGISDGADVVPASAQG